MAVNVTPQLKLPLHFNGLTMDALEQGTFDEISQSVFVIVSVPQATFTAQPELGYIDQTFAEHFDDELMSKTISDQEPRASFTLESARNPTTPGEFDVNVRLNPNG